MQAFWITLKALLRRFATIAGSALLTFAIERLLGWAQESFLADPKTAILWPAAFALIEFVQKYWRTIVGLNKAAT